MFLYFKVWYANTMKHTKTRLVRTLVRVGFKGVRGMIRTIRQEDRITEILKQLGEVRK